MRIDIIRAYINTYLPPAVVLRVVRRSSTVGCVTVSMIGNEGSSRARGVRVFIGTGPAVGKALEALSLEPLAFDKLGGPGMSMILSTATAAEVVDMIEASRLLASSRAATIAARVVSLIIGPGGGDGMRENAGMRDTLVDDADLELMEGSGRMLV